MIGLALLLLVLSSPCELFPAIVWKFVTDDVVLQIHSSPWIYKWFTLGGAITNRFHLLMSAIIWLFLVYLTGEALGTLDTWILSRVAQKFVLVFRNRVYHKLQSQSLGYLQRQRTGDLMSRAMNDVDELQGFIVSSIDVIVSEGLLWLVTVGLVMYMDWRVASISLAPLFIVYFLLRVFNKKVKPIYSAARDRLGDISTRLQENLSGVVVIKIFGRERQEAERFEQTTEAYYHTQIRAINARNLFFPLTRVVGFFSNIFMVGVGGYFMLHGRRHPRDSAGGFTPGKLVAFRAYWWRLFGPIQTLARVNDMVQRASAAGRRVFEVLDAPDELPDTPSPSRSTKCAADGTAQRIVHLRSGTVPRRGPGIRSDRPVQRQWLTCASAARFPGRAPRRQPPHRAGPDGGVCGPSGSGKSSVLNLLLRFYDPLSGQVLLDGRPLPDITGKSAEPFRPRAAGDLSLQRQHRRQHPYGHSEADGAGDRRRQGRQRPRVHHPTSARLRHPRRRARRPPSGGQKQRISIARTFLANPGVLLLDEPTSSVEPDSEAAIIAALRRLMAGRTTVLTSHRPSLIYQADQVYVLEDGRVTAQGKPGELMEQEGWFSLHALGGGGDAEDRNRGGARRVGAGT